jgi:hypothetical protein
MKLNLKQRIKNLRTPKEREGLVLSLEKDGNRYYTFPDPVAMPNIRHEQVFARINQVELGITKENLIGFVKTLEEAGSKGELGSVMMLVHYFKNLIEQPINVTPMLYLSMPLIILNDEPVDKVLGSYEDKKLELQKGDEEVRIFFLQCSISMLQQLQTGVISTEVWKEIMNPVRRRIEDQFLNLVTTGTANY